jgi:hypothetical protein
MATLLRNVLLPAWISGWYYYTTLLPFEFETDEISSTSSLLVLYCSLPNNLLVLAAGALAVHDHHK